MKVNLWSPLPPSSSGIADYVAEQLPLLGAELELTRVVEDARDLAEEHAGLHLEGARVRPAQTMPPESPSRAYPRSTPAWRSSPCSRASPMLRYTLAPIGRPRRP